MAGRIRQGLTVAIGILAAALGSGAASAQNDGNGLYSLLRTQDDLAELKRARDEIDESSFDSAVERLHTLLARGGKGVVPAPIGIDRFYGIRHAVIRTLREMPPEGQAAYDRLVRRQAAHLAGKPLAELRTEELERLAHVYPTSDLGRRARLRLGDLALERGDGRSAEGHFRAAADADPELRGLAMRRVAARALATGEVHGSGDVVRQLTALRSQQLDRRWSAYGGGGDGSRPMPRPIGKCRQISNQAIAAKGFFDHHHRPTALPMHPVGDLGGIFVTNGLQVFALDALGRNGHQPMWRADGPMTDVSMMDFENVAAAINPDMVLSAAVNDRFVIASMMVPNDVVGASQTHSFKGSINIIRKISSRRLFAFDRTTGKIRWSHWDRRGGRLSRRYGGHDACGPPLIVGDTVYVPTHDQTGAIAYYLRAYDVETGAERWRSLICSSGQEVNMFGNARQEFAAAPLAFHEGVVYGSTNLGVCFAADAADGSVRWISGYETIPLPRTRLRNQRPRQVFFANNPPAIHNGVMACTPLDSAFGLGIDTETGRTLWRLHHEGEGPSNPVRWLLGALGDEFIFSGLGIVAVESRPKRVVRMAARSRLIASAEALGEDAGHHIADIPRGALTKNRIYFLDSLRQLHILDRKGNEDARRNDLEVRELGNLLLVDGIAVASRANSVSIYANLPRLQQDAERAVRRDPDDPSAHLRLATITLAATGQEVGARQIDRAIETYERGLDAAQRAGLGEGSAVFRDLADGHFKLSFQRARHTVRRDRSGGLVRLLACRDAARRPSDWIKVQLEILESVNGRRLVEELDALRDRFGREEFRFPKIGRMPVAAYALWKSIDHVAPLQAAARCQDLLLQFGEVSYAGRPVRDLATRRLTGLIEEHGARIYAPIEAKAAETLRLAEDDADALRIVAIRYPHSSAATAATARLIEIAVAAGDLETAASVFATTKARGPGTMRRMMVAAEKCGNLPLARTFGSRLIADHGNTSSDYEPDSGITYAEIVAALPNPTAPTAPKLERPRAIRSVISPPNAGTILTIANLELADGFPAASTPPLFVSVDDRALLAFRLNTMPNKLSDAAFELPLRNMELEGVVLCGDTAIVCEHSRVRGVELATGKVKWTRVARDRRQFTNLGVIDGLVLLYSSILTGGDGGELHGIEPLTGTEMFARRLPDTRDSFTPVRSPAGLFYWDIGKRPAIVRVDPLTGADATRIELTAEVLKFLGLEGPSAFQIHRVDLQTRIVADADKVVIPIDDADDSRPRVIAISHAGRTLWKWHGRPGQSINMCAALGDRTVILTSSSTLATKSQLTILDRFGQTKRSKDFGPQARAQSWRRRIWGPEPAPELLVLAYSSGQNPELACISLVNSKPFFKRPIPGALSILRWPLVGENFLALPIRTRARRGGRARVDLIDLDSPLSQRLETVPTDLSDEVDRLFALPLQLVQHGNMLLIENPDGIVLVGESKESNR